MIIGGLEVNSPEYWELRHSRDEWPRSSSWAMSLVCDLIPSPNDSSVLIVGCGQGMEALYLAENCPVHYILAFDVSCSAIRKAKRNLQKNEYRNIDFEVLDVFESSLPKGFDYILSIQNFEHWKPEVQPLAINKIFNSLRDGGKMFFTGVGKSWDLNIMNSSPMKTPMGILDVPNDYHYNKWSEQEVYDLFMTVKADNVTFFRRRGKDRVIAEAQK